MLRFRPLVVSSSSVKETSMHGIHTTCNARQLRVAARLLTDDVDAVDLLDLCRAHMVFTAILQFSPSYSRYAHRSHFTLLLVLSKCLTCGGGGFEFWPDSAAGNLR